MRAQPFADYLNRSRTSPHINFVGVGGRTAFNVRGNVQMEAVMAYDFKRKFTTTFSDGVTTQFVSTDLRTLHALFGPKIEPSGGPVRFFGTFKVGLINFSTSNQNVTAGFNAQSTTSPPETPARDSSRRRSGGLHRSDWAARRCGR